MKRFFAVVMVLCALATALAGCASPPADSGKENEDITVVFVPKITGNAFFEAANEGAQAYAEKHGFTVDYRGSAVASAEEQVSIIRQAVEEGVDAICVSSLDATALDEVMREAMAAGIHVVTWDSDVSCNARQLMVSQGTPDQLGKMLVEMGAKSLESRGISPASDTVAYVWHYSQATVVDQNSWWEAGEAYIASTYPNWVNVTPENYYSGQDPDRAVAVGRQIFSDHPAIDLVICNDSTSLPGQAQAAQELGLTAAEVTITGFASPNSMRQYCEDGIVERWGLWDCQVQGALGCYLAYYLASGNTLVVGDKVDVPDIGLISVMPNTVLSPNADTSGSSGVVLLPERTEFTADNIDDYNF